MDQPKPPLFVGQKFRSRTSLSAAIHNYEKINKDVFVVKNTKSVDKAPVRCNEILGMYEGYFRCKCAGKPSQSGIKPTMSCKTDCPAAFTVRAQGKRNEVKQYLEIVSFNPNHNHKPIMEKYNSLSARDGGTEDSCEKTQTPQENLLKSITDNLRPLTADEGFPCLADGINELIASWKHSRDQAKPQTRRRTLSEGDQIDNVDMHDEFVDAADETTEQELIEIPDSMENIDLAIDEPFSNTSMPIFNSTAESEKQIQSHTTSQNDTEEKANPTTSQNFRKLEEAELDIENAVFEYIDETTGRQNTGSIDEMADDDARTTTVAGSVEVIDGLHETWERTSSSGKKILGETSANSIQNSKAESQPVSFKNKSDDQKIRDMFRWLNLDLSLIIPCLQGQYKIKKRDVNFKKIRDSFFDENVDLTLLEKCCDRNFFKALKSITSSRETVWRCGICDTDDRGKCVYCDSCLTWFHYKCVEIRRKPSTKFWFCAECFARAKQ